MMKGTSYLFIVFALISCVSEAELELVPETNILPLELVRVKQVEFGMNGAGLRCETEIWYPCTMYGLVSEESFDGSKISITFTTIVKPDICLQMGSPARRIYPLDSLSNGVYVIELNHRSIINRGTLTIGDDVLTLDLPHPVGIEVVSKVVRKRPKNTYIGYILYGESSLDSVNQLLDKIQNIEGVTALNKQVPGVYTDYEVDENGECMNEVSSIDYDQKTLIFQYQGTDRIKFDEELKTLLDDYRHNGLFPEVSGL